MMKDNEKQKTTRLHKPERHCQWLYSSLSMGSTKFTCTECLRQIVVTPQATWVRCDCKAVFTIGSNGQLCQLHNGDYPVGSLAMQLKLNSFSQAHPRRRALLCGVSYNNRKIKLKGTMNDVGRMRSLLVDQFNFPSDSIFVLAEDLNFPNRIPTKQNVQKGLKWLVEDCQSGDSLVFYFSGHGLRQPDFDGDEVDGFDETLCPVDFKTAGMILDNEINNTIVKPLKEGVTLHAIIDTCHSGTILDLEHVYDRKNRKWVDNKPPSGAKKSTSGGHAICFSACEDHQLAADTNAFSGKEMAGAMTFNFVKAIKSHPQISYGELLNYMHEEIEAALRKAGCLNNKILNKMFRRRMIQEPQLSSSKEFNVETTIFKL
ncbi:metacaspase-1-like isoform X2 [Cornus florida]|uniref:metacaspase-1-like isoform X2 n=1 Tax=Cornus florida TaxID=4283 RepID=UPI00289B4243|nr:metacaspase-1-like isoform X2 [Cornus florida]